MRTSFTGTPLVHKHCRPSYNVVVIDMAMFALLVFRHRATMFHIRSAHPSIVYSLICNVILFSSMQLNVVLFHIISEPPLLHSHCCMLDKGSFKCHVTLFFWKLDLHPPPRNANNIEPYTFVTFFPRKSNTHPPTPAALRNT